MEIIEPDRPLLPPIMTHAVRAANSIWRGIGSRCRDCLAVVAATLAALGAPLAATGAPLAAPGEPLAQGQREVARADASTSLAAGPTTSFAREFAAHQAAGRRFGHISVRAEDVFDTSDPREDYALYRLANRLHVQTRPQVIERALLFKRGDAVSMRVIEETERVLRAGRYLADVQIRPLEVRDDEVDVEIVTRDTWSLDIAAGVARAGGENTTGIRIAEYNLLGTGVALSLGRFDNVDRTSTTLAYTHDRALGTWARLALAHATNSDGERSTVELVRPFHALDARWAAGASGTKDNRIDSVYASGKITSQYRVRQNVGEAFAGWSTGLRGGWVQRVSAGVQIQDDAFAPEPGTTAPPLLPPDRRMRAPFVRWDLIEDRTLRESNRNLMGRPEFFALGWLSTVQIGHTLRELGSTQDAWLYALSAQRGFEPADEQTLLLAARLSGQYFDGQAQRQRFGVDARWYAPLGPKHLFYAGASMQWLDRPDPAGLLRLGGDDGLRGYPLRWQNGTRRALLTLEQRWYSDVYLWRLLRLGGAAFVDVGRAWGGDVPAGADAAKPEWLSNVGAGIRIVNTRWAFRNVLHVDVAVPLNATGDVKRVQLLVRSKTTF